MKIKNIAIIILMTAFFIIIGTKVYATTGKINENTVNLKRKPDSKTILDYLNKGDEVEILEKENGWYKVKVQTEQGKVTGYVSEEFIDVEKNDNKEQQVEEEKKEPENIETNSTEVTTQKNETNIEENKKYTLTQEVSAKILPLINSREKSKITGDITVIEIINDWAKIENETENGWIRKNTLKKSLTNIEKTSQEEPKDSEQIKDTETQETVAEPEKTTTEVNKIGYVSAEGLRVRKEPSTESEELDSLSKNDKVKIIGKTGNWYKIDMDGEIGYVSAKYISDTKITEVTSRSGSTLKKDNQKQEEQQTEKEDIGKQVVEYAKKYLGYKYVSGGTTPKTGFDCSGFTQYVYKNFEIELNRTASAQEKNGITVEKEDLKPGDIVLFNNDSNTKIGHVGIYIGEGNFIHASNPSDGVKITTLKTGYYQKRYVGARRVI